MQKPILYDRVRYTLYNDVLGSLIITEPIGWNDDDKEYTRLEQYHGIIAKFSNSLKFIHDGANYLQTVYQTQGINATIKLTREEKHPHTDIWTYTYSGYLDISTWSREQNQVSMKFNSGGLEQILKSREGEEVEIERTTTIDGTTMPAVQTINVNFEGREIFLKSKLKATNTSATVEHWSRAGDDGSVSAGVPFVVDIRSHENIGDILQDSKVEQEGNINGTTIGVADMMFLLLSDKRRELDIVIDFSFLFTADLQHVNSAKLEINLTKYNGIDYNVAQRYNMLTLANKTAITNASNTPQTCTFANQVTVEQGQSLSIEARLQYDLANVDFTQATARAICNITACNGTINIAENSTFEPTTQKAVLAHELADRLVTIATNKNGIVRSSFLGRSDIGYTTTGTGGLLAFIHGFWVRGFDASLPPSEDPKVENLFKPLTTSFKDFVASLDAVFNVGIGIETEGRKEVIRIEELDYFYSRNVTIKLPNQVSNIKRSVDIDKYYNSIEVGYVEGGSYEEAFGLDEYNKTAKYTTVITRLRNIYSKLSKYRADSYGLEFTRRKQKITSATEDTPRDNAVWFLDLKKENGIYTLRKWADDFSVIVSGVFSPQTATHLRLSPLNNLLRHGWWLAGGLTKYPADYIAYASSGANSNLETNGKKESSKVLNASLERAKFVGEQVEFEHICDFEIMQLINGTTQGKPNFYGLVEYTNELGLIERGYIISIKPNGKGVWTILKSNR